MYTYMQSQIHVHPTNKQIFEIEKSCDLIESFQSLKCYPDHTYMSNSLQKKIKFTHIYLKGQCHRKHIEATKTKA